MKRFRSIQAATAVVTALLFVATVGPFGVVGARSLRSGSHSQHAAQAAAVFTFGRSGGNIRPVTIRILADGSVTVEGPTRVAPSGLKLSKDAIAGLVKLAKAERFFSLPGRIEGPGVFPDAASLFITASASGKTKTVYLHNTRNNQFNQLFAVLEAAAGVTF
jgi:hypothetical protein